MAVVYLFSVDSSFADQYLRLNREDGTAPVGGKVVPADLSSLGPSAPLHSVQRNEGSSFFGSDFLTVNEDASPGLSEIETVLGDGKNFERSIVDEVTGGDFYSLTAGITGPTQVDLTNPYQLSHTRLRNTELESILEGTGQAMRIQGTQRLVLSTALGGEQLWPTTPPADGQVLRHSTGGLLSWSDPLAPASPANSIQFNNSGSFGGSQNLAYEPPVGSVGAGAIVRANQTTSTLNRFALKSFAGTVRAQFRYNSAASAAAETCELSGAGGELSINATEGRLLVRATTTLRLEANGVQTDWPTVAGTPGQVLTKGSGLLSSWTTPIVVTSGGFLCTLTFVSGLAQGSQDNFHWVRVGNVVTCTTAFFNFYSQGGGTPHVFTVTLPVARTAGNFSQSYNQAPGVVTTNSPLADNACGFDVRQVNGTQTVQITWIDGTPVGALPNLRVGAVFSYRLDD